MFQTSAPCTSDTAAKYHSTLVKYSKETHRDALCTQTHSHGGQTHVSQLGMSVLLWWPRLGEDRVWAPLSPRLRTDIEAENKLAGCSDPREEDNSLVDIPNPVRSHDNASGPRATLVSVLSET